MRLNIHKNIFNECYLPYLEDYSTRIIVFYGGAGSGKSFFIAQRLVYKALKDKRKILVLRKVNRTTKASTFQLLLDTLIQFGIINHCRINRTDFTITLPNGSQFLCMGLDDPEKIKSITGLTDAWLEEATEFTLDDFSQVNLRIRDPKAANQQIVLSFNPVSKANWCYLQFFQDNPDLLDFRKSVKIVHTNYQDNRFLPEEYIESLLQMKKTNPVYYKIYALGEFGSLDKLVYNNWQVMDFDPSNIKGQSMCGLDFGYTNDPTAFVYSVMVPEEQRIYICREWGGTGYLNDAIADRIREMGFAKSIIMADSAEQKSIDEIKRSGIDRIRPCAKGKGSILQGIQKVQQYELIVHPSCRCLKEELENYSWKKDKNTNEYINEPIDEFNHYLDALRYSLQCLDARIQLKSMDKDLLF
jgi:phage terminase large subunit